MNSVLSRMEKTTKVVGYYNGYDYPVQLVVSAINVTLYLKKGEYILDRNNKKVNDPIFETFANNKQLSRELSSTPVPINAVPIPDVRRAATQSVQIARGFKLDSNGLRKPDMAPVQAPAPTSTEDKPSMHAMSMEEARARGLAKRVREVPEDYGETDTSGQPSRTPPPIKYAMDPSMLQPKPPLPKELVEMKAVSDAPARSALISQLTRSSVRSAEPESAAAFLKEAVQTIPSESPIVSGIPAATENEAETPPVSVDDVPEPELDDENEPAKPAAKIAEAELKPLTSGDKFTCPECKAPFKYRSQLAKHARSRHTMQYRAIMDKFPDEDGV